MRLEQNLNLNFLINIKRITSHQQETSENGMFLEELIKLATEAGFQFTFGSGNEYQELKK